MNQHIIWISCLFLIGYVYYTFSTQNTILGTTPEGIPAYTSTHSFKEINHVEWKGQTIITGWKWECVEFVRRYLLNTKGIIFKDVTHANEIWGLLNFINVENKTDVPCMHYSIGTISPRRGDILIWADSERNPFGHVAIILQDTDDKLGKVEIAEQNWGTWKAPHYSRRITLGTTPNLLGIIRLP